jgi:hypothetical protein
VLHNLVHATMCIVVPRSLDFLICTNETVTGGGPGHTRSHRPADWETGGQLGVLMSRLRHVLQVLNHECDWVCRLGLDNLHQQLCMDGKVGRRGGSVHGMVQCVCACVCVRVRVRGVYVRVCVCMQDRSV